MSSICCIFVVSFVNVMESALSDGSIYIHMCYLAEKLVSGHQKNGIKLR